MMPAAEFAPLRARVWPASGIAQVWFAARTIGALMDAEAAPVPKAMPPLPSVSVPNAPWLIVVAPVPLASNVSPRMEKFCPSVVT